MTEDLTALYHLQRLCNAKGYEDYSTVGGGGKPE
jgi:hypothetical protein